MTVTGVSSETYFTSGYSPAGEADFQSPPDEQFVHEATHAIQHLRGDFSSIRPPSARTDVIRGIGNRVPAHEAEAINRTNVYRRENNRGFIRTRH